MPKNADRKQKIRALMKQENIPYSEAARRLDNAKPDDLVELEAADGTQVHLDPLGLTDTGKAASTTVAGGEERSTAKDALAPFGALVTSAPLPKSVLGRPGVDRYRLPFGVNAWDLSDQDEARHLIVTGRAEAGKSVLLGTLAYRALEREWDVLVIDLLKQTETLADSVTRLTDFVDAKSVRPRLVVVDHAGHIFAQEDPDFADFLHALERTARIGRGADVHIAISASPYAPVQKAVSATLPCLWAHSDRIQMGNMRTGHRGLWSRNPRAVHKIVEKFESRGGQRIPDRFGFGVLEPKQGEPGLLEVRPPGGDKPTVDAIWGSVASGHMRGPSQTKASKLGIGVNPDGAAVSWDTSSTPNLAIVGATGSGKTTACRAIAASAERQGWDVEYINPKVDSARTDDILSMVYDLAVQRAEKLGQHQVADDEPMLVIIDEAPYLTEDAGRIVQRLVRVVREAGIHVVVATPPGAPSRVFGSREWARNLLNDASRLILGELDKIAKRLWFRQRRNGPIPSGPGGGIFEPRTGPASKVKVDNSEPAFEGEFTQSERDNRDLCAEAAKLPEGVLVEDGVTRVTQALGRDDLIEDAREVVARRLYRCKHINLGDGVLWDRDRNLVLDAPSGFDVGASIPWWRSVADTNGWGCAEFMLPFPHARDYSTDSDQLMTEAQLEQCRSWPSDGPTLLVVIEMRDVSPGALRRDKVLKTLNRRLKQDSNVRAVVIAASQQVSVLEQAVPALMENAQRHTVDDKPEDGRQ